MSTIENKLKTDLARKVTFEDMSNVQKKEVIDQLFPNGVAFWYADPKASQGDKVFGWGDPNINEGGFFFGEITGSPSGVPTAADLDLRVEY